MTIRQRLGLLRLGLLGRLPGETGLGFRERERRATRGLKGGPMKSFQAALQRHHGMVHLDLGANLGIYTTVLSENGSRVYAFEPDPWTAERLRENVSHLANVVVVEAAAGTEEKSATMYRKVGFDENPETISDGTSLIAEKSNVDTSRPIEVKCLDLRRFLDDLDGDIGIIKIDIEGAEVELLEALLDWDGLGRVGSIFVETHETRIPTQRAAVDRLWRRTRGMTRPYVNLDWR